MSAIDVVRTRTEAAALPVPPLIVEDALVDFLDAQGIGAGPLALRRIGEGHSNATFSVVRGAERLVFRRGPRPPFPASTHDMLREARIQRAVRGHGIPVPEIVAVCEDPAVLGVPFYLMRELDGEVVTDRMPPALDTPAGRGATLDALVDLLAALATVPVDAPDIAPLGRPDGYLDRQLATFAKLWHAGATRDVPDFDVVAERLADQRPAAPRRGVVHGDFRLGNVMLARETPGRILGLLDWEMATLGDPLADVGYVLATYTDGEGEPSVMELSPATSAPGFATRGELATRLAERFSLDPDALDWYRALALWKAAVFCEEISRRWQAGEHAAGASFGARLEAGVPDLLARARALL